MKSLGKNGPKFSLIQNKQLLVKQAFDLYLNCTSSISVQPIKVG